MNDPPRRRPGRPPVDPDDPSVPVTVSLPSQQLAACAASATHDRLTLHDWIRQQLRAAVQARRA